MTPLNSKRSFDFSCIKMCINCGQKCKTSQSFYECKYCYKKMDKYFEVNKTLFFIDLLLAKEAVLRHIIFNREMTPLTYISYFLLLFISSLFSIENHTFLNLYFSLIQNFLVFMLYYFFLKLFCKLKWKDVGKILLLSYYGLFNYFFGIWNYKRKEYKLIIDFFILLINSRGIGLISNCKKENYIFLCFLAKCISQLIVLLIKNNLVNEKK